MAGKCRPSLRSKTIENVMRSSLSTTDKTCIKAMLERVELLENEIKAISEDAVKVVRCGKCRYKFSANGHDKKGCPLDRLGLMTDEDFCSAGKRREENEP